MLTDDSAIAAAPTIGGSRMPNSGYSAYAISSGDKANRRRKIAELMDVVSRADR